MQTLENMDVFEILITQKLPKGPKDPFVRSALNCFFYFMTTKFKLVLLPKIILKITYSKSCILYHITYTTIEALLYQP